MVPIAIFSYIHSSCYSSKIRKESLRKGQDTLFYMPRFLLLAKTFAYQFYCCCCLLHLTHRNILSSAYRHRSCSFKYLQLLLLFRHLMRFMARILSIPSCMPNASTFTHTHTHTCIRTSLSDI